MIHRAILAILCGLVAVAALPGWSLGQDQIFATEPAWTGILRYRGHNRIALADIDRDGDLDLVSSAGLHWNTGAPDFFVDDESWNLDVTGFRGPGPLALGDVNQDGFVDVVTMTSLSPQLVLNRDSVLDLEFIWEAVDHAHGVALADLDADGDLDLVCGGDTTSHAIYVNEGTESVFADIPVWNSGTFSNTPRVVVGDLDLDGDLDLVFGNNRYPGYVWPNQLFLNNGSGDLATMFPQTPDWEYAPDLTLDMALGDVDGDGDLDLFVVNWSDTKLLLNRHDEGSPWTASIFDETAAWTLPALPSTDTFFALELGDVDHDGDLDLVVATRAAGLLTTEINLLFLNEGPPSFFAGSGIPLPTGIPAPRSGDGTTDIDLGDVDGDGDLDLITAHNWFNSANAGFQVFLNNSPSLSTAADNSMFLPLATRALAAGDVDLDGDPDLIAGNQGRSYLYLSSPSGGSTFPPIGEAINNFDSPTRALALADFDADGDPDLAFGNYGSEDGIYRNVAGSFEGFPFWESRESAATSVTTSLAAGDLDGDGRPDLITGNANGPNRLYSNTGSTLGQFPAWEGAGDEYTQGVALADLDDDGDVDAVFGNRGQKNTVYLNDGTTLAATPLWRSRDDWNTTSVAIGDVDGDRYPDLVFGNDGQPNTLYLNSLGALAGGLNIIPWYSAESDSTTSVALVDVDGDGDLDLVCGNIGTGTAIYINSNGIFPSRASFRTATIMTTRAVALADFDLDGDIDLACGNDGQANTVHLGQAQPLLPRDFTQPTHHRPNNPSLLSGLRVINAGTNRYAVAVTAADVESDPVGLVARFRFRDSPHWQPVEIGLPTPPLPTSPGGETHQFQWDVSRLAFDRRDVILQVSTIPDPQRVHEIHHMSTAQFSVGPLEILRAQLATEPILTFPRVTVGDTVAAPLVVTNSGNADLVVTSIQLPSSEMWLSRQPSFTVAPGATTRDTVFLAPTREHTIDGGGTVSSNDPLAPASSIAIEALISALTVETAPLVEGDTAPLGQALTIQTIAPDTVRVERAALWYRRAGAAPFASIEMTRSGRSFIGIVPGPDVMEGGLEYFVEVENSGVFATDPADTTGEGFFVLEVAAPTAFTVLPVPTSGADYLAGREIAVQLALADGVVYAGGTLHYRRGGESGYTSAPIADTGPLPVAVIPDSMVGPRGVEYWVEVTTSTSQLTDPPTDPATNPRTIRVRVADLAEPALHAGYQYRMVSVPLDFGADFSGTIEALLADQAAFGPYPAEPYDLGQWRCFRGFPPDGAPRELPAGPAGDFRVEPGRGYWLISRSENRIATNPVAGTSTATDGAYAITLAPGWNMIGHPFAFPVAWDAVLVDGEPVGTAPAEGPWSFDGASYVDVTLQERPLLEPFAGYWIRNSSEPPRDIVLSIPPQEAQAVAVADHAAASARENAILWQLMASVTSGNVKDEGNRLGVGTNARDAWDPLDRHEPPSAPERSVSLAFSHASWAEQPGRYATDYRAPAPEASGHAWRFDVTKDFLDEASGNIVDLVFTGLDDVPGDLVVRLLDRELDRVQDLRNRSNYAFHLGIRPAVATEEEARFVILVGAADYVDDQLDELTTPLLHTALHQNYPNPFNPETVIRWEVAKAGRVELKIYDLAGSLVRTAYSGAAEPGGYEFVWRGEDDGGRRMASGVYIYRLKAGDILQTRRMTLLK